MSIKISFGAGCFWGVEHAFKQLPGVLNTTCGYQGGEAPNPTYEDVCTKLSGHAEVVLVEFDQTIISVNRILDAFYYIHDSTQLNAQGPDIGPQYKSCIFTFKKEEYDLINLDLVSRKSINPKIVTILENDRTFYDAEVFHQNYLNNNPGGYCHIGLSVFNDLKNDTF